MTSMPEGLRRAAPPEPTLGERLSEVTGDLSLLIRQELELAKAEAGASARRFGVAAALWATAGVAALFVLQFVSLALWVGVAGQLGPVWAALAVALVWLVLGVVFLVLARPVFASMKGLPQTAETISRIPEALNPQQES